MNRKEMFTAYVLFSLMLLMVTGCAPSFQYTIQDPASSSISYEADIQKPSILAVNDARSEEDKIMTTGTLMTTLTFTDEPIANLGKNVEKELVSRKIPTKYSNDSEPGMILKVKKYHIRNLRSSGFTPYYSYTTFSGDLVLDDQSYRIAFYYEGTKTPVWSMNEIIDPCYNIPISLLVKEIASKINRYKFKQKSSDAKVQELLSEINNETNESTYLKVMELGYTNNESAIEPLAQLANHEDVTIRLCALSSLGLLGATEYFELFKEKYNASKIGEKSMALKAIGDLGTDDAYAFLEAVRSSPAYEDIMIKEVVDLYLN